LSRSQDIVQDIGDNHKVKLGKMASGLWVSPRALAHCSNAGALTLITAAEENQADIGTGE